MPSKRHGKLIARLTETAPMACASEVCSDVVKLRLKPIRRLMKLARRRWRREPEHVHRLRVAIRRAQVTLHFFADQLPAKAIRSIERHLKRIRRAANAARDIDVLLLRYEKCSDQSCSPAEWREFLRFLRKKRSDAQIKLDELIGRRGRRSLSRRFRQLFECPAAAAAPTVAFRKLVEQQVHSEFAKFFRIVEKGDHGIESLHRLRIAGKRVRYVLELGTGAYARAEFEPLYHSFCQLQEQFGVVNDLACTVDVLDSFLSTHHKIIRRILKRRLQIEQTALQDASDQLLKNWDEKSWQDLNQKLVALLNRDASAS
ncbi:MAG: CHAD domain-containing protein [Planctomycetaceae bacterium]|nr:CHAD domain-containing protein [Planctomycetaceae bacterium]